MVNANDVAVTGVQPRWFLAAVLLPPGTSGPAITQLFADMQTELQRHRIALAGGHIEISDAVTQPIVVGQMLGLADDRHFVRTGGARPGQVVLQVGPAPIEGAAVIAAEAGTLLAEVTNRASRGL